MLDSVRFDIKNPGNAFGHSRGKPALASFIITDHILANAELLGELRLRQVCLKPGA